MASVAFLFHFFFKPPFKSIKKTFLAQGMTIQKKAKGWPGLGCSLLVPDLKRIGYESYYNKIHYQMLHCD